MIVDQNVELVRKAREELVRRHGDLDGLFTHFQSMDRQRAARLKKKKAANKTRAATPKKSAKKKAKR